MASLMVGTLGKSWVRVIVYYGLLDFAPSRDGSGGLLHFDQVMWEWWVNVDSLAVSDVTSEGRMLK